MNIILLPLLLFLVSPYPTRANDKIQSTSTSSSSSCFPSTPDLDPKTYNKHMISGMHAYNTAWSNYANDSPKFYSTIIQAVSHFRQAMEMTTPDTPMHESALWQLSVTLAYIESREEIIDVYNVPVTSNWSEALLYPLRRRRSTGLILELGVGDGFTLKILDTELTRSGVTSIIHGFDSFYGLPSAWGGESSLISQQYPQGYFNRQGIPPQSLPPRVKLHIGMLKDTLPNFVNEMILIHSSTIKIAFLHIDVDIYSSTWEALASLSCLFAKGTVIEFDEALGYLNWKNSGEWRAFVEFSNLYRVQWKPISTYKMRLAINITDDDVFCTGI